MFKIKRDINLNNFHSIEIVGRVSETTSSGWQFQWNNIINRSTSIDYYLHVIVILILKWERHTLPEKNPSDWI